MRQLLIFGLIIWAFSFYSCSELFNAYIRNRSNKTAIIDVFLLDKTDMETLPNKVTIANRIVSFKSGYKKHLYELQNVVWVDTSHFKLDLQPNTTADLSDMVGLIVNHAPRKDIKVTVTANNKVQTLVDGRYSSLSNDLFRYKYRFMSPILYYDIE